MTVWILESKKHQRATSNTDREEDRQRWKIGEEKEFRKLVEIWGRGEYDWYKWDLICEEVGKLKGNEEGNGFWEGFEMVGNLKV